jgi:hypothetical protein
VPTINQADGSFLWEGFRRKSSPLASHCADLGATLGVAMHIFPLPCAACRWSYADEVVLEGGSCSLGLRLGFHRSGAFCSLG